MKLVAKANKSSPKLKREEVKNVIRACAIVLSATRLGYWAYGGFKYLFYSISDTTIRINTFMQVESIFLGKLPWSYSLEYLEYDVNDITITENISFATVSNKILVVPAH